jgi:hypothetical protein
MIDGVRYHTAEIWDHRCLIKLCNNPLSHFARCATLYTPIGALSI